MIFYYTEIVKDNLDITNVIGGQFVFCTDTFDVFYDRDLETRIQIDQGDVFFLNTDEDREAILNPLKNKIYYVKSTNTPYRYNGEWFKITDNDMIMQVVFDNDDYFFQNDSYIVEKALSFHGWRVACHNPRNYESHIRYFHQIPPSA